MIVENCASPSPDVAPPAVPFARVAVSSRWPDFLRLRPQWDRLAALDPDGVLLGHDWVAQCWKSCPHLRRAEVPLILTALDASGALQAALPLRLNRRTRRLCFLEEERSQRFDLLAPPGLREAAWRAAADFLSSCAAPAWDRFDLQFLRADSVPEVRAAFAARRRASALRGVVCQRRVDLARPWEEIESGLSPYLRANARRRLKRLQARGAVSLACHVSPLGLGPLLRECFALEQRGWKGDLGTAIADLPSLTRFYRQLAFRLAARGRLRLFCLRIDARLVAFEYCLADPHSRRLASLKIAYDEDFAKASPGAVLRMLMLRQYLGDYATYEFLGDDARWKAEWTDQLFPLHHLRVFNRTPGGAYWRLRAWAAQHLQRATSRPSPAPAGRSPE